MHHPNFIKIVFYTLLIGEYMKTLNDVVVERLLKFMAEQNLTQYKLAEISGVPYPTIYILINLPYGYG